MKSWLETMLHVRFYKPHLLIPKKCGQTEAFKTYSGGLRELNSEYHGLKVSTEDANFERDPRQFLAIVLQMRLLFKRNRIHFWCECGLSRGVLCRVF